MLFENLGVSWTIAIAVISSNPMSLMILAASRTLVYHVYNRIYIIIYRYTEKETVWDTRHPSYPNTDGQGTHGESLSSIFCVWSLITIEVTVQATPFMSKDRCAAAAFKAGGIRVTGKQLRMMSFISKIKIPHVVIYCRWCRYRVLETDDGLCWCSIIFHYINKLNISENFIYSSVHRFINRLAWKKNSSTGTLFFCVSLFGFFVCWPVSNLIRWFFSSRTQNVSPKFCRSLELQKSPVA